MSDLIDREQAMNSVADIRNILEHMDTVNDGDINRVKRAIERILAELPTIDAESVIRCKDCKHYGTDMNRINCTVFCCTMPEKGFCSMADRKDHDSD